MVLSTMRIDSTTPRGGRPTTSIVVLGFGFGVVQGTVVFDPLGEAVAAVPTLWQDDQIDFPVPALVAENQFVTLLIEKSDGSDSVNVPFWIPHSGVAASPTLPPGLDYQYPVFELGTVDENTDNPRRQQAADMNRIIDEMLVLRGLIP